MTADHDHWFIGDDEGRPIRCACGLTFTGFIAWSSHRMTERVPHPYLAEQGFTDSGAT